MKNMKLTNEGARLLGEISADGQSRYWIGYYGLAYVPDRDLDSLDEAARSGQLTQMGDRIYNIWQGDMLNGYAQANPEDTAAASLFGLTLYDRSIRTNYRYVYDDENECNRLVAWKSISTGNGENTLERKGVAIYMGAHDNIASGIPIPAPLFYDGEPDTGSIYANSVTEKVSADWRYYVGTTATPVDYGWLPSDATQDSDIVQPSHPEYLRSISNFNKFHGTASSEGYGVSSVSSCHNMSKATKLFPISYYNVVNDNGSKVAETQYSDNSPARKPLASAIKFSIDLSPVTADTGYTALNYEAAEQSDDQTPEIDDLFSSKYISFRFNRIGIYAVPMTVHRYSTESSTDQCNMQKVEFEINGDEEPILFAVADVSDTLITDNPNTEGVAKFTLEFTLNFPTDTETQVERRTAVYYNLYENDATTWYKNQLLASASLSEAVTDLSLEVNALKQNVSGGRECSESTQEANLNRYALKNHSHDYMKNLADGADNEGSVRGIYTCEEGNGNDIISVFGRFTEEPGGTKKSTILTAVSESVSGTAVNIPDSYVYCLGPKGPGDVALTDIVTEEQLRAILKSKGANWLYTNVATNAGWARESGGTIEYGDPAHLYVWLTASSYAKITLTSGLMEVSSYNAGSSDMYLAIYLKAAISEPMFSLGYSVGKNAFVAGENTASSGELSLVQGRMVYNTGDLSTVVGSDTVRNSGDYMNISGSKNVDVSNSSHSLLFIDGACSDTNGRPAGIKNVNYSIIGGEFSDDGNDGLGHGMEHSIWLASYEGDGAVGAAGTVSGTLITGNVMLGNGDGTVSASNSVILRQGKGIQLNVHGQAIESILIGEGTSSYNDGTGNTYTNSGDYDKYTASHRSIMINANIHSYFSGHEALWCDSFRTAGFISPTVSDSVVVGADIGKPVHDSIIVSSGELSIAQFSVNSRLKTDNVPGAVDTNVNGGIRNIMAASHSMVGYNVRNAVMLGTDNLMPDNSDSVIMVGNNNWYGTRYNDEMMTLADFNAAANDRSGETYRPALKANAYYVIYGDGKLVTDSGQVQLSGSPDHIYGGIRTDANKAISYAGNGMSAYNLEIRRNYRDLRGSLVVGNGNRLGSINTDGLTIVGGNNEASLLNLSNVSIFGSANCLNRTGEPGPVGMSSNLPVYASVSNVHIFNSNMAFNLNSTNDYATHSFSDALVLLGSGYDRTVLGIYDVPVETKIEGGTTTINNSSTTTGFFEIDPCMFSNYKDAFATKGRVDTWNAYNTGDSVSDWLSILGTLPVDNETDTYGDGHTLANNPFKGKTRAQIRTMLNKPNAPMVYTGGIALAGIAGGDSSQNYALLKLGHISKPASYVNANPVFGWAPDRNLLQPISITGTTNCPYEGMTLAIDGTQELDGTLHVVLSRPMAMFVYDGSLSSITGSANVDKYLTANHVYNVNKAASATLSSIYLKIDNMAPGEECIVRTSANNLVKVRAQLFSGNDIPTLAAGQTYLIRRVAYNPSSQGEPTTPKAMIIPIGIN